MVLQEPLPVIIPSTGHIVFDVLISSGVLVLGLLKAFEYARSWGLLPRTSVKNGNGTQAELALPLDQRPVSRMHGYDLRSLVKHEIRDQLQIILARFDRLCDKQDELKEVMLKVNENVREVCIILRERRSD